MASGDESALGLLFNADTTLGIVAGLTVAARKKQDPLSDDEDTELSTDKKESSKRAIRRQTRVGQVLAIPSHAGGDGDSNGNGPPSSTKKYSVQEQRDVIRKLQERNQILKQELSIESRDAKLLLGQEKRQQLEYLQKMTATFTKKLQLVKKTITKLDEVIAKKQSELEFLRQQQQHGEHTGKLLRENETMPGHDSSTYQHQPPNPPAPPVETAAATTRRIRALENRLELSLVKKNEMDSINKHLRVQIDKTRKDRIVFDGIYKKLEKELCEFRQRYELCVEELRKTTEAKKEVTDQLLAIQTHAEADQREYEQQFQTLKANIEAWRREATQRAAIAAVSLTGNCGAVISSHVSPDGENRKSNQTTPVGAHAVADAPSVLNGALTRITALSSWKIGYDKALATSSEGSVAKYEEALAGIKKLTGMTDVTKIAQEILRRDDANFKRFKHVEELHREELALQAQVEQLTSQIDTFKAQEGLATNTQQKQQFRELEAKLQLVTEKNKAFDSEYDEMTAVATRIKSCVHSIHSMLVHANCARNMDKFSQGSAHLTLGAHSARDVTDTNVLEYLKAIETYVSSFVRMNQDAEESADGSFSSIAVASSYVGAISPVGHGPPTLSFDPAQKLQVHVPSFGGMNGAIVLPPSSPYRKDKMVDFQENSGDHLPEYSPSKLLQRKQTVNGRLDSSSRSLGSSSSESSLRKHDANSNCGHTTPLYSVINEEGEEERALTYQELKQFAIKHTVKRKSEEIPPFPPNAASPKHQ